MKAKRGESMLTEIETEVAEMWRTGRTAHSIHGQVNALLEQQGKPPVSRETVDAIVRDLEMSGYEIIVLLERVRQHDRRGWIDHAIDATISYVRAHEDAKSQIATSVTSLVEVPSVAIAEPSTEVLTTVKGKK
jgi:hypothetical protein